MSSILTYHLYSFFFTCVLLFFYFFNATPTTEIYTLSLHDALPIFRSSGSSRSVITLFSATNTLRIQKNTVYSSTARQPQDRKSTRLNSSHVSISYAVFCLKKKKKKIINKIK